MTAAIDVHAMSHITGGGLPGNLPRVLPDGLGLRVEGTLASSADLRPGPARGDVAEDEMRRTFNGGVGFVIVVAADAARRAAEALRADRRSPVHARARRAGRRRASLRKAVEWPA